MAFGRFETPRASRPLSDINITPLVDVMLVLVVIFILAAPLLAGSLRLQLPRAEGAQQGAAQQAPPVSVALDAAGQAYLQDEAVTDAVLAQRLHALAGRQPDAEVALRADTSVPYGRVVQIMGAAHAAGLRRIGFVTQPAQAPAGELQKP